jgi:outer membrane protein OmpA-like peptidoglycan-associated protein
MVFRQSLSCVILLAVGSSISCARHKITARDTRPEANNRRANNNEDTTDKHSGNRSENVSAEDKSAYTIGKPLEHGKPLKRPSKVRDNELNQLQAKSSDDTRDVDARSQAGVHRTMDAANTADQHAQDAASTTNSAQTLAGTASTRTDALNTTVGNLDQYSVVTSTSVPFAKGRTALSPKGKADLDDLATKLASEKGYIVEVQGYSGGGVQASQAIADSVVRYLVTEHQVPIYRIYRTGMGKNAAKSEDSDNTLTNGVRVALMHNSLATTDSNSESPSATHFPWPPPLASAEVVVPRTAFESKAKIRTFETINSLLSAALDSSGYAERNYYDVPGGFALVTHIEHVDAIGRPLSPRWSTIESPMESFSLSAYVHMLFTSEPGHYRVIVIVVSSVPFSQSNKLLSQPDAEKLLTSGTNTLPRSIGSKLATMDPMGNAAPVVCTALIYEWKTSIEHGKHVTSLVLPSPIGAEAHLHASGLWQAFHVGR